MGYQERAIKDRYLHLNRQKDQIIYLPQGKERRLSNPEEQVQLDTYLSLIYDYGYPARHIRVCEKVQIGSSTREADIVVYLDDEGLDPWIIIECKRKGVSASVFETSINQAFSYAAVTGAQFVWATSGDHNAVFQVLPDKLNERTKNRLDRIPKFKELRKPGFKAKRSFARWLKSPVTTDTILYSSVLLLSMIACSWFAVEYDEWIRTQIQAYWQQYGMDYRWLFYTLASAATCLSMAVGLSFMRSHRLFGRSRFRRNTIYFVIFLILLAPAWAVGQSMGNPQWWSRSFFLSRDFPILVYLWPYVKSFPLQFFALYGLIWLSSRGNPS